MVKSAHMNDSRFHHTFARSQSRHCRTARSMILWSKRCRSLLKVVDTVEQLAQWFCGRSDAARCSRSSTLLILVRRTRLCSTFQISYSWPDEGLGCSMALTTMGWKQLHVQTNISLCRALGAGMQVLILQSWNGWLAVGPYQVRRHGNTRHMARWIWVRYFQVSTHRLRQWQTLTRLTEFTKIRFCFCAFVRYSCTRILVLETEVICTCHTFETKITMLASYTRYIINHHSSSLLFITI